MVRPRMRSGEESGEESRKGKRVHCGRFRRKKGRKGLKESGRVSRRKEGRKGRREEERKGEGKMCASLGSLLGHRKSL